ncbi:TetR/AcrR family transcriptional regulator [Polyangium sp. y55x31]|uniref:TetR/AcrR family transcriptional regulator n=1 Tax=Polyangium sp. y55x31 TaxID=3042688 RepID=UPI002482751D|nr:TetR/AcrR family transcriptional regulator [Polyangium sp. y55x31]MDI1479961.1 TetR/AcrR family transcriptional regulator [Polyangium sp. y55x31]
MSTSRRKPKPRVRRDAESARALILEAAAKRLVSSGPSGIRLQEVAADAGMSHPTVLHHFGSREALVKAVCSRALESIHRQLIEAIEASSGDEAHLAAMLEAVFDALTKSGHGRVLMWLALEGQPSEPVDVRLADVVDATHAMRKVKRREKGLDPKTHEDTAHVVVLVALALLGSSVIGPTMLANAGLEGDDAGPRFRAWLTRLLLRHLDGE